MMIRSSSIIIPIAFSFITSLIWKVSAKCSNVQRIQHHITKIDK